MPEAIHRLGIARGSLRLAYLPRTQVRKTEKLGPKRTFPLLVLAGHGPSRRLDMTLAAMVVAIQLRQLRSPGQMVSAPINTRPARLDFPWPHEGEGIEHGWSNQAAVRNDRN